MHYILPDSTNRRVEAEPQEEIAANDVAANHDDANDDEAYGVQDVGPKASNPRKKRTRKAAQAKNQPSLDSFARRPTQPKEVDVKADEVAEPTLEEDLNLERKKRRKTASPKPTTDTAPDLFQQLQAEAGGTQEVIDDVMVDKLVAGTPKEEALHSSPPDRDVQEEAVPESSLPQAAVSEPRSVTPPETVESAKVTPKKQIKVTKTGKLVSSPPKKPEPPVSTTPKRRGRPRKAARNTNLSSTITVIRYGSDKPSRVALGQKIDAILSGGQATAKQVSIAPPRPAGPPKPAHPFFTGKAGQKKVEVPTKPEPERRPVTPRKSACTPGKLRAERRKEQDDEDMPAFGMSSKNRLAKQSGLHEPLWPSKELAHVRNIDPDNTNGSALQSSTSTLALKPAKMKHNVNMLSGDEEIITKLAKQLSGHLDTSPDTTDLEFAPPEDVRLPARLLTTGIDIQNRVRSQIRAPIETLAQRLYAKTHPAITSLYDEIEHTLTPFDEGRCESQAWAQKYRPLRADRVLQPGKEAFALKDWLKSLTVLAVGAAQDPSKTKASLDTKKPPKKKRKTAADDFIVFSDEEDEDEEMVDLDPNSGAAHPSIRQPRWTRNKNVVLLSGPHGCGKSATVYAVAKELDFEVFELHSGVRRSGKDIQDKVGDMTANHLVNHQRGDVPVKPKPAMVPVDNDTDNEREKAFQKDLDSGRQGTMTSFFTAKPGAKPKSQPKPKVQVVVRSPTKTRTIPAAQAMLPVASSTRKSQKQSLILIEEADILFEEDQNFWAQIIKLAAQSKRPIVITCNDELHIPTQALPMAAILRLTPPPLELATDYLVALAGREGHILQRQALADLYESKHHDLRASITELNFWCQMSVGDKRGGLEWMYQRWPPGKDVDANGRLLRVASEDTYQPGMGWLSHNVVESRSNVVFDKDEELLKEVWNDWGISPSSWSVSDPSSSAHNDSGPNATQPSRLEDLDRLLAFTDALSAADIYARTDLPSYTTPHDQPMDPTLPSMPAKERLSYTTDAPMLQVDPYTDFLNTDTSLASTTHLLTTRLFPGVSHRNTAVPRSGTASLEQSHTRAILAHTTASTSTLPPPRSLFTCLDILATPTSPFNTYPELDNRSSYNLVASCVDHTLRVVVADVAPYVRSIVAHELALETQRVRLGSLLSEGGRSKRARTTKASRTAMEGGERQEKRRERWFHRDLNFELVMRTAGSGWAGIGWKGEGDEEGSLTGTQRSTDDQGGEMVVDVEAE
jgi:DNA polymerase III delta prime subunit